MTDEELIETLRGRNGFGWTEDAADRIEQLVKERDEAEAKLTKAVKALRLVTDACDEGKMVSLGAGGMTIYAQIRQSVYNKVPAWPIEEARSVLDELGRPE
jgi:hypothetical protein